MGDMNAKIGEGEDLESGVGRYGLGTRNERGEILANFCKANNMMSTTQPPRRRYTWKSPGDQYRTYHHTESLEEES